jgi:hypothetical protein
VRDLTARSEDLPRLIPAGAPVNDVIKSKDGSKDTIDCGTGSDRVTVDAIDVVSSNCEQVIG